MKKLLTFFALLLLVVSCTKEADISPSGDSSSGVVSFSASAVDMTSTKATLINSWSGGEEVALFVDGDDAVYHFTIAADGTMSGDEVIVDREASITYTAFYPYDSDLSTIEAYQEACTAGNVDYMTATTTTSGKDVALQFSHQMAAITYSFVVAAAAELPTISLAVDGNINTMVALDLEKMKETTTIYMYEASYFIADGTDVSSMLVKLEQGGSTTIQSITREGLSSVEAGKQYLFSYTIGDLETGEGLADDPYIVYTANDMRKVGTDTDGWALSSHYILAWDIDLGSEEFTAIGTSTYFTGTFDGAGYEISGLYINQEGSDMQALFGYIKGATIKNLTVSGSVTGNDYVGGIVGRNQNAAATIENCYNKASVNGVNYVGGVVGYVYYNSGSKIENCGNAGSVEGSGDYVGGVAGYFNYSTVSECYNTGSVKGLSLYVGGVVGYPSSSTVSECYNTGSVEGSDKNVGGVVGYSSSTVSDCYNSGSVEGSGENVGGVVGYSVSTVSECYNTGSVEGSGENVGGVVGENNNSTVSECYNTGSVDGSRYVGGVVGYSFYSTVSNCYNTGSIEGSGENVGGVVGYSSSTVSDCYNTGSVDGSRYVGGIVGENNNSTVSNCYNTGSVEGSSFVGGIVGYSFYSTVSNCYNTGSVEGSSNVGGVVGRNIDNSSVSNCYNTGSVEGSGDYVGGVVGYNVSTVSYCYYLTTAYSGSGVGYNNGGTVENVANKTASEMQDADFVDLLNGEDGTSWMSDYATPINNGYPILINND